MSSLLRATLITLALLTAGGCTSKPVLNTQHALPAGTQVSEETMKQVIVTALQKREWTVQRFSPQLVQAEITVRNRGGLVRAEAREDGMVRLSGNATVEWRGSVDVHLDTRTAGPVTVTARHDEEVAAWRAVVDAIV